jgi:hypothetical protein
MTTTTSNPDKTPVASDVFTYCTKEKIETWHVVRNHNASGIVDKVVCKACKSEHKYKPKALLAIAKSARTVVKKSASSATPGQKTTQPTKDLEGVWFSMVKKWGNKEVAAFDPSRHFNTGEVFEHPTFGKGVVQARRENKIDVVFPNGLLKTLISK